MTTIENRKSPRINSYNLLAYVCLDENNDPKRQGMGRTLNVSEGGILLETHAPIDPQYIVSLTISLEDEIMDIKGKVVYNKERDDGKSESGIQFIEIDESKIRVLKQYVVIFKDELDNQ